MSLLIGDLLNHTTSGQIKKDCLASYRRITSVLADEACLKLGKAFNHVFKGGQYPAEILCVLAKRF